MTMKCNHVDKALCVCNDSPNLHDKYFKPKLIHDMCLEIIRKELDKRDKEKPLPNPPKD
jgi:hypothetical protein